MNIQFDVGTILFLAVGSIISLLLGIVGFYVRSILKKLDGMMSKELCGLYHQLHDREHDRMKTDINAVGGKLDRHLKEGHGE